MNNQPTTLGQLVRERRERLGWLQGELAEKINNAAERHKLRLTASNGSKVVVDNMWISRLETDKFKRPLPEGTLRAVFLALEEASNADVYDALNRQINIHMHPMEDVEPQDTRAPWPLHERLPNELKSIVQPYSGQPFPNSMMTASYIKYIKERLEKTTPQRALMCAFMDAPSAAAYGRTLSEQMRELVSAGLTVVYCSGFTLDFKKSKGPLEGALLGEIKNLKDSHATAVSNYATTEEGSDQAMYMVLPKNQTYLPPAVIESRDVLVIFGRANLEALNEEARNQYLWAEVVNCSDRFVPREVSELHALILYAGYNRASPDEDDLWYSVRARIALFRDIIERWESEKSWPEVDQQLGIWKRVRVES